MAQRENQENRRNMEENENNALSTIIGGTVAAASIAAVAGGMYWLFGGKKSNTSNQSSSTRTNANTLTTQTRSSSSISVRSSTSSQINPSTSSVTSSSSSTNDTSISWLIDLTDQFLSNGTNNNSRNSAPSKPITNLNSLLSEVYVRYIALKKHDFTLHYKVFTEVYLKIHKTMKEVDSYYGKYSSKVQCAGSHFDGLRIIKPDEFDVDIVINLPLSIKQDSFSPANSDFYLEPLGSGYVRLKMGTQYSKLPKRDGCDWHINKTAYDWSDEKGYLLRSRFTSWFHSVVTKALKRFHNMNGVPEIIVEGVPYTIRNSSSGPAYTLFIENNRRGFKLDVDLVPALKFPEDRWPICRGYRSIPFSCKCDYWMVVPKIRKDCNDATSELRSWRLALHEQEKKYMKNLQNLKTTIKLLKKLRDTLGMKKIASYYIKTLFFWEIVNKNDPSFWRNDIAFLFDYMVRKLHEAMLQGNIPYFWNKDNNLIGSVKRSTLDCYASGLYKLITVLDQKEQYKKVANYLLTAAEYEDFKRFLNN